MKATAVCKSTETIKFSESVTGLVTATFDGGAASGGTTGSSAAAGRDSFGDAAGEADVGDDAGAVSLSLTRDFPLFAPIVLCMCRAAGPATAGAQPQQMPENLGENSSSYEYPLFTKKLNGLKWLCPSLKSDSKSGSSLTVPSTKDLRTN